MSDVPHVVPLVLQQTLDAAYTAALSRRGGLPIWHRQAVYAALGPPGHRIPVATHPSLQAARGGLPCFETVPVAPALRTRGHLRRTALAIQSAYVVIEPSADGLLLTPSDTAEESRLAALARLTLAQAEAIYRGEPAGEQPPWLLFEDAVSFAEQQLAIAGMVRHVALWDSDLQMYPLLPALSDSRIAGMLLDTAYVLSLVLGSTFHTTWLTVLVPQAYLAHPEP